MAEAPPAPAPTRRILLAGDVHGRLATLFARVQAASAKAGPFDALFCVGGFFPAGGVCIGAGGGGG